MEGRADLAFQVTRGQKCRVRIDFSVNSLEIAGNGIEMLRLGSELQLRLARRKLQSIPSSAMIASIVSMESSNAL